MARARSTRRGVGRAGGSGLDQTSLRNGRALVIGETVASGGDTAGPAGRLLP